MRPIRIETGRKLLQQRLLLPDTPLGHAELSDVSKNRSARQTAHLRVSQSDIGRAIN